MDNRKRKTFAQTLSTLWLFVALLLVISSSAWAVPTWIDNFNSSRQDLNSLPTESNWTWNGNLTLVDSGSSPYHTADATDRSGRITAGTTATYSTSSVTEGDWGSTYDGQYIGLYIWGSGGAETLSIVITEQDPDKPIPPPLPPPAVAINETWTLTSTENINWTGWRYKMYKLPDDFTASGGDGTWNPVYVAQNLPQNFEIRGAVQIDLVVMGTNDVYVDEITLSDAGTKTDWVTLIFPTRDVNDTGIDITLDRLPPTISAVLGTSADITNTNTNIYVIEEDPTDNNPSFTDDDLIDSPNDVRDDVDKGLFATPNDTMAGGAYLPSGVFTVFIRPANSSGDFGQAEVITFQVSSPSTEVGTEYHREVTE